MVLNENLFYQQLNLMFLKQQANHTKYDSNGDTSIDSTNDESSINLSASNSSSSSSSSSSSDYLNKSEDLSSTASTSMCTTSSIENVSLCDLLF